MLGRFKLRAFPYSGPTFGRPEHRLQRESRATIAAPEFAALGPRFRGDERWV